MLFMTHAGYRRRNVPDAPVAELCRAARKRQPAPQDVIALRHIPCQPPWFVLAEITRVQDCRGSRCSIIPLLAEAHFPQIEHLDWLRVTAATGSSKRTSIRSSSSAVTVQGIMVWRYGATVQRRVPCSGSRATSAAVGQSGPTDIRRGWLWFRRR